MGIPSASVATAASSSAAASARTRILHLRRFQSVERGFKFLSRRSEILQQFHFVIEMNQESLILFFFPQGVIHESGTRAAFLIEHAALAQAGIHEEADCERQIILPRKIGNRLRTPVFVQSKIVLGQIRDDLAVLVAHDGGNRDDIRLNGYFWFLSFCVLLAKQKRARHKYQQGRQQQRNSTR